MEVRFNRIQANLRAYLRKRGAEIDTKRKTVKVNTEILDRKAMERVEELKKWGYVVNEALKNPPHRYRLKTTRWKANRLLISRMK